LSSSSREGDPYQRRADVELEIARTLAIPRTEWLALCRGDPRLSNEAIVFLAREAAADNPDLCGQLIHELGRSVAAIAKRWAQGFDPLTTEELVWQVEQEIIECVLTPVATRQSDFLEIAFGKAVERRTINAVSKRRRSPLPLSRTRDDQSTGEDSGETPADQLADDGPTAEDILVQLQEQSRRRELIRQAIASVKDRRHLEAVVLRHVRGWPMTDSHPNNPSLVRYFGKSDRQIRTWITEGLKALRAAMGESK
jgi:hypothetical protein